MKSDKRAAPLRDTSNDEFDIRILDAINHGSTMVSEKLMEIACSGVHKGVFGGVWEEAAAQAILALHKKISYLTSLISTGDKA